MKSRADIDTDYREIRSSGISGTTYLVLTFLQGILLAALGYFYISNRDKESKITKLDLKCRQIITKSNIKSDIIRKKESDYRHLEKMLSLERTRIQKFKLKIIAISTKNENTIKSIRKNHLNEMKILINALNIHKKKSLELMNLNARLKNKSLTYKKRLMKRKSKFLLCKNNLDAVRVRLAKCVAPNQIKK